MYISNDRFLNGKDVLSTYAEVPEWPNGIGLGYSQALALWLEDTYWLSAYWGSKQLVTKLVTKVLTSAYFSKNQ